MYDTHMYIVIHVITIQCQTHMQYKCHIYPVTMHGKHGLSLRDKCYLLYSRFRVGCKTLGSWQCM